MRTLLVSHGDVATLLPMAECIDVMADALRRLQAGEVLLPLRQVIRLPDSRNLLGLMPAHIAGDASGHPASIGAKVITVFPGNDATPYDSHIGVVLLFDEEFGRLLAIMDASSITAIRTAAVSGLATRLLARPDAGDLAILGAGVQARTHLEAMRCVRELRRVRVWSRNAERARSFAWKASADLGIRVTAIETARQAVEGADLICTVTASREPVLEGAWIAPGAHVNAVGAALPTARELDSEAVRRARVFVDRRESAWREAGDLIIPRDEGVVSESHVAGELGELLAGRVAGRDDPAAVTLFKSLGIAVEDVAAARYVYDKGRRLGTGVWMAFGGMREEGTGNA